MSDLEDILDDPEKRSRQDPRSMGAAVAGLPDQCRVAWQQARHLELPAAYRDIDLITVLGMGGSAIAGDIFRLLLADECAVPVLNHRNYDLPAYVNERALVIASSFSGNTEETASAFERALATPAKKLAVTTGGRLLTSARANGVPTFVFAFRGEPRAAFGYSLMPLLAIAESLGLMQGVERDVEEALAAMESLRSRIGEDVPLVENEAKKLAVRLHGRLPIIYGAEILGQVAHRWKTQFNESSKVWAFYEQLPEADHNAIVSLGLPRAAAELAFVIYLRSASYHPRVSLHFDFHRHMLNEAEVGHWEAWAEGASSLAQAMTAVLMGDYVSYYLALVSGMDPTPTTTIDNLKAWLAQQK